MPVGGRVQYRHLGRDSAHRKALLRNLVTSLIKHESIQTTWPKAKEAQRLAEKLITLGKRNTPASRIKAQSIFYVRRYRRKTLGRDTSSKTTRLTPAKKQPHLHLPKLFNVLRHRYAHRPGGYTRVLRLEPLKEDQAPSAILELVDSPKDMRFALTAQTIARDRMLGRDPTDITRLNMKKVTQFRPGGVDALAAMVQKVQLTERLGIQGRRAERPQKYKLGNSGRGDEYYFANDREATEDGGLDLKNSPKYNT